MCENEFNIQFLDANTYICLVRAYVNIFFGLSIKYCSKFISLIRPYIFTNLADEFSSVRKRKKAESGLPDKLYNEDNNY